MSPFIVPLPTVSGEPSLQSLLFLSAREHFHLPQAHLLDGLARNAALLMAESHNGRSDQGTARRAANLRSHTPTAIDPVSNAPGAERVTAGQHGRSELVLRALPADGAHSCEGVLLASRACSADNAASEAPLFLGRVDEARRWHPDALLLLLRCRRLLRLLRLLLLLLLLRRCQPTPLRWSLLVVCRRQSCFTCRASCRHLFSERCGGI